MPNVYIPDVAVTLVPETCYLCGVPFAMPEHLRKQRLNDRLDFWCPNGHPQHYLGPTEAQKLKDELAREKHRTEQARADADAWKSRAAVKDRQLSARKGQITRIKNRVANGVCPCCNRTFQNLGRHMQSQHPAWSPKSDTEAGGPPAGTP